MTVTLETLRADFDAARSRIERDLSHRFDAKIAPHLFDPAAFIEYHRNSDGWFGRANHLVDKMLLAANVFTVASCFDDEKEALEAAMLYKLSGGNIDPRKDGAA
jgi:hypothetical protein